jgi:FkbM family methyltransferase
MALYRQEYLNYLLYNLNHYDYMLVIDFDLDGNVNIDGLFDSLNKSDWGGIFCNGQAPIYGTLGFKTITYDSLANVFVEDDYNTINFNALIENFFWIFGYEDNFKSFNIGIANKKGELELRIGQPEIGGHHKTLALDSFCGHPITTQYQFTTKVKVDTLDNLIAEHNLPTPDHIKIDIDGSEYAFLLGASKSLLSAKSIIIELYEYNEYFQKIMNILENEYKFKLLKQSTELEPGLRDYWFIK